LSKEAKKKLREIKVQKFEKILQKEKLRQKCLKKGNDISKGFDPLNDKKNKIDNKLYHGNLKLISNLYSSHIGTPREAELMMP
jgi:hypothetical protein